MVSHIKFDEGLGSMVNHLFQGMEQGSKGCYDEAIRSLAEVISSATRLLQLNPAIEKNDKKDH